MPVGRGEISVPARVKNPRGTITPVRATAKRFAAGAEQGDAAEIAGHLGSIPSCHTSESKESSIEMAGSSAT